MPAKAAISQTTSRRRGVIAYGGLAPSMLHKVKTRTLFAIPRSSF